MNFATPEAVPLAVALKWTAHPNWLYETKADGCRAALANGELQGRVKRYSLPGELPPALARCTMDGELVARTYYAFDLLEAEGRDLRQRPLRERRAVLLALQVHFPPWLQPIATARPGQSGGEYLQAVLRDGGEGCVAKRLSAPYGFAWYKTKARETFDAVVTSKTPGKLSVAVAQYRNGALVNCGRVAVTSRWHYARIKPGDVLELAAQGRTAHGKFREPRFLKVRTDKPQTKCKI